MPAPPNALTKTDNELGVVVIGRNEGDRLRRCLSALGNSGATIVYVDSGSSDRSVEFARSIGVEVVELDMSSPFTAGRARNEGFARLDELCPRVEFVQFLDGDCELNAEWLPRAVMAFKTARRRGRRLRFAPGARARAFDLQSHLRDRVERTGGRGRHLRRQLPRSGPSRFARWAASIRPSSPPRMTTCVSACGRRRSKILRLDAPMAWHDAAMTRLSQWWKRAVRSGYAYAQVSSIHGRGPYRHFVREARSAWFWGVGVPVAIVGACGRDPRLGPGFVAGSLLRGRVSDHAKQSLARFVAVDGMDLRGALPGL